MPKMGPWTEKEIGPEDTVVGVECEHGCGCIHYGIVRWLEPERKEEWEEAARAQEAQRRVARNRLIRLGIAAENAQRASPASSVADGAPTPTAGATGAPATAGKGKGAGNGPATGLTF